MSQAYPRDIAFCRTQHRFFLEAMEVARVHLAVQALQAQRRALIARDEVREADTPRVPEVVTIMEPSAR
jgi:hypothetical protein